MFSNVKTKKRLTQLIIAFVVVCMTLTGSFLLLEDTIDSASAATTNASVATAGQWNSAVSGKSSGDVVNITLTGNVAASAKLDAIPAGVTVNLNMAGYAITWDTEVSSDASIMSQSYPPSANYWGLITNKGTLNITGTGTIRMKKINYNEKNSGNTFDNYAARAAAIVNSGESSSLTIGSGITVENYLAMCFNDYSGSKTYADMFLYGCAVYNEGTVVTSGKITSGTMATGVCESVSNSYNYAFSYGIYGGTVTTKGGTITSLGRAGGLASSASCKEANQIVAIGVGVYSNAAKILGDTTINTETTTWMSSGSNDLWGGGVDISVSVGVMYLTTNYPVIGASADINSTFICPGGGEIQAVIPGTNNLYYTVKNADTPGEYARRANPVAGVQKNQYTIGSHSAESTWSQNGGFFGTNDSSGTNTINQYFNFNGNMYYYPEEAYFGGFAGTSYRENASSQYKRDSGSNTGETLTGKILNGVPGDAGTQYKIMYRYYDGTVSAANLISVSPKYDTTKQNSRAILHIGGSSSQSDGTLNNGSIDQATSSVTFGSGGVSKNSNYYKLESTTYEKVATATFANRDYNNMNHWTANGTLMGSGSVTMTTANTLVVYMNYILKSPSAIRVVAGNNAIDQYTETTSFTSSYTGKALVPGTDFYLGIIDMGVNISVDTNDAADDTVVTSVYDISGTGSGSGNNKTAVTYRYTTDQTEWSNGLPKDAGTYTIEVNVNADTTFASSGTYNRQATTQLITCTITKVNITIGGSDSKTGTYGSTYSQLIPFADYTATGLGSDQLEGAWSYAGVDATAYPNAGQSTVHLVWTPTAGTKSANNYNSTTFAVALNVEKRAVTVNAGACTVTYGDSKPVYALDFAGTLAECDKNKVTEWFNTSSFLVKNNSGDWVAYAPGLAAGTYEVMVESFGGAADENNTFTLNVANGSLAVSPRNIVYRASAIDRAYNGSADVDVKLNYVSGNYQADIYDTVISTTGTMPAGANAGELKQVSVDTSAIIIKNSNNYKLVVENIDSITVNIAKANPTGVSVVANPATAVYDSTKTLATAVALDVVDSAVAGNWAWKDAAIVPTVDVATYTAVFTPTDTVNYNTLEQQVVFTVEQKEVIVTVKDYTISYGDAVPAITGSITYTGFTGKDTVNTVGVNGGVDATTTYTRGAGIGEYPVNVVSTLTSTNYYFTAKNNKIVVNPRALKITAADETVTYGAAVPGFDASDLKYEGFYGTDNYTVLGGSVVVTTTYVPGADVGSYPITASGYTSTNYAIEYVNGALTVNKATLTVTPNNVAGVTYGADAPAYAADGLYKVTGFVAGDTVETVVIDGTPVFTTAYQSGKDAGSYPVSVAVNTLSSTNYSFVGAEGTLTVGKATPAVTEVPGATVINAHTFAEATFDGTETVLNPNKGSMTVEGTFAFKDGATVAVWGSDGMYQAVFTPDDTHNYNTTTAMVYLEILEKTISGKPVIQGSAMSGSTLTVSLASMDPTVAQYYTFQWYADEAPISGATGTSITLSDSDIGKQFHVVLVAKQDQGFTGTAMSDKTSKVIQALLETTAAHFNAIFSDVEYDAMSHKATVSIADGYNAQYFGDITVKYNGLTAAPTSAGKYIVTVDVGVPEEPAGGYPADTYYGPATGIKVGEFEITPAPFTVTVLANDKVYDGTVAATATVTGAGLKDEMDDVRIAEGSKFAFSDARVGTDKEVKVVAMQLTGAQASNYVIDVQPVTASITPRAIYYKALGVAKTYDGSALVNATFTYDVTKNDENADWGYAPVDSASTIYPINGTATAVSADAGTQVLASIESTAAGSSAANYEIRYSNLGSATVVINKAVPNVENIVINDVEYDSAKTLQTVDLAPYTTSGGFWQFDDLTIVPSVAQKTYAATFKSTNKNYTDCSSTITINVNPKAVLLTADDKTIAYGSKAPVFTITASGFTGEDTLADIGGSCTPVCTYAPGSAIGSYAINLNNALSDDNYIFTTAAGTLTVAPARINVSATATDKVYDGTADISVKFAIVSGKYGNDDVALNVQSTVGQSATANAGPTTVTYTAPILVGAKAENYELYVTPASGELKVTIAKADVAGVTFPVDATVEFGYDLRFAKFAIDGVGDGTFAFENAKNVVPPQIGLYEYVVVFTPTDARNFNTQEAVVSLEVIKCKLDYVVGIAGSPQQGETLAVVFTGLPSQAEDYVQYQWYRVSDTETILIKGATSAKYVATEEDVGYTLAVATFFNDDDPFEYEEGAYESAFGDEDTKCIIGASDSAIVEVALTFWQRLLNWIKRIIAAITGMNLSGGLGG